MVTPFLQPDEESEYYRNGEPNLNFSYSLKFSVTNKHNILTPGIVETGFLVSGNQENKNTSSKNSQCFIIEYLPNQNGILISKSLSSEISMYVSYGTDNFTPDAQNSLDWAMSDEVAIFLPSESLNKRCKFVNGVCRIYFCIFG